MDELALLHPDSLDYGNVNNFCNISVNFHTFLPNSWSKSRESKNAHPTFSWNIYEVIVLRKIGEIYSALQFLLKRVIGIFSFIGKNFCPSIRVKKLFTYMKSFKLSVLSSLALKDKIFLCTQRNRTQDSLKQELDHLPIELSMRQVFASLTWIWYSLFFWFLVIDPFL